MKIVIASGKGGTGKTTFATSLVSVLARKNNTVSFIDCDVEEPNSQIFLKPKIDERLDVSVRVPSVNQTLCTNCGECASFCSFNALAVLPKKMLVFPELCHSCKGCIYVCPNGAIKETTRKVGVIESGRVGNISYSLGRVNIGEARVTPIISMLKKLYAESNILILDAPPGTSCSLVETLKGADVCVLIAEPTPFGLNDLKIANCVCNEVGVLQAVVVNKCDVGNDELERYCHEKDVPIFMKIPHDKEIAHAYSEGRLLIEAKPKYENLFFEFFIQLSEFIKRNIW